MNYIHLYQTDSDFQSAYNGTDYAEPGVSLTIANEQVNYNKDLLAIPLTYEILTVGDGYLTACSGGDDGQDYTASEYNKNGTGGVTLPSEPIQIPIVVGDKIQFRGNNPAPIIFDSYTFAGIDIGYSHDSLNHIVPDTCTFNIYGNIMSLVSSTNFKNLTTLTENGMFYSMFAHTNVVSAEHLILPAIILTPNCYFGMFNSCNLLTVAPTLPAATLARECYSNMFTNCTNLNYIKCLATDISASNCTQNGVSAVSSTGTFVKDPNATGTTGTSGIPTGGTVENSDGSSVA